jgi:phospholipid/cholesterol/gamma-HCH transport system substrate-binding protein
MNERQMQFRVGLVVFATMIVGFVLAGLNGPMSFGWLPWGHSKYQIGIQVNEAPGVDTNTPVRKNGILIGRVKSIEDKGAGVLLHAEIDGNRPLYADFEPHIRTTVLGDSTIDFVSRKPTPGMEPAKDGAVFVGRVDPNPFDSLGQLGDLKEEFSAASRSLAQAGDEVSKLANRVNVAFGDDSGPDGQGRVKRLLDTTERAMNQFAMTMESVNEIIGDEPVGVPQPHEVRQQFSPQLPTTGPPVNTQPLNTQPLNTQPLNGQAPGNTQPPLNGQPGAQPVPNNPQIRQRIRQGLDELPDAIHEFRVTLKDSRVVLQSAERNFKNLEAFTEPLGQKGPQVADAILKAVDGLDQLLTDLGAVARALNNREGTIGKLISDPVVYENLSRLICNANTVLGNINDLTFQVKPVVHDARIFMDKVATEPGRIVTGGLNPSTIK